MERVFREIGVGLGRIRSWASTRIQFIPWSRARVALDRVDREVLELGERLHPRVPATDEDVGELLERRVLRGIGGLERLDHVVAQPDRVGELLNPIARSRPGTGSSLETEPSARMSWS